MPATPRLQDLLVSAEQGLERLATEAKLRRWLSSTPLRHTAEADRLMRALSGR
jgi:hypothetical protein